MRVEMMSLDEVRDLLLKFLYIDAAGEIRNSYLDYVDLGEEVPELRTILLDETKPVSEEER